jgi:hypothetical protein
MKRFIIALYVLFFSSIAFGSSNHLEWEWFQGGSPNNGFPTEFHIYRGVSSGVYGVTPYAVVPYTGQGTYSYDDMRLSGEQLYFYAVQSVNSVGATTGTEVFGVGIGRAYFVASTGNDSNTCLQAKGTLASPSATPKLTIQSALSCIGGGDTLYIRTGTYSTRIQAGAVQIPTGASWNTPATIAGFPSETVIIQAGGNIIDIPRGSGSKYLIFQDLIFNSLGGSSTGLDSIPATIILGGNFTRLLRVEVKNWATNGIMAGIQVFQPFNELLNVTVHADNTGAESYGIHIQTDNTLIDQANIYAVPCFGIIGFNPGNPTFVHHNIVANSTVHNNGISPSSCAGGIVMAGGDNNGLYNNVVYDTGNGGPGIYIDHGAHATGVYNNTLYNNAGAGILILNSTGPRQTVNTSVRNNILFGNESAISDSGFTGDGILRCFVVRAYSTTGVESQNSNEVCATETNGEVVLAWDATTTHTDGSPATDLLGYRVYYGTVSGVYPNSTELLGNVLTTTLRGFTVAGSIVNTNITTDPTFVDSGSRDLHIQTTSIAKDTGVCLPAFFSMDHDGFPRPQGAGCDVGAYEFLVGGGYIPSTPVGTGFFRR